MAPVLVAGAMVESGSPGICGVRSGADMLEASVMVVINEGQHLRGELSVSRLSRGAARATGDDELLQPCHLGSHFAVGGNEVGIIRSSIGCKCGGGGIRAAGGLGMGWHTGGADVHDASARVEVSNKLRFRIFGIADCLLILAVD